MTFLTQSLDLLLLFSSLGSRASVNNEKLFTKCLFILSSNLSIQSFFNVCMTTLKMHPTHNNQVCYVMDT